MRKEVILVTVFILFVNLALVQESHGIGGILTPPKWRRSRRRTHFYGGGSTRRLVPIVVVTDRKIKLKSLFRCVDLI